MIHILIAIDVLLFIVAFSFRNKWQFIERDSLSISEAKKANSKWHTWQGVVQLCFFALIGIAISSLSGIIVAITYMAAFWILFDGILNVSALDKSFFYVGKTAFIDRQFQRFKRPSLVMAITKFIILIASSVSYIIVTI